MKLFYRYSDKGKDPTKHGYKYEKTDCFESFKAALPDEHHIHVVLDNCEENSANYFYKQDNITVYRTSLGNSKSALYTMKLALECFPDDNYYFTEDDYLYSDIGHPNIVRLLSEGLEYADYCSLYDHGDKYSNFNKQPNPNLTGKFGEVSEIFRSTSIHWKLTNSTTMTFAVKGYILKNDIEQIEYFLKSPTPLDFQLFTFLNKKNRRIATSIPGLSTHLSPDHDNMSPFFKYD